VSDQNLIVIIAALPSTLAAIGALIVSIINTSKANGILTKTTEIHDEQKNSRPPFQSETRQNPEAR
jgi:hypothetical protein